MHSAQNLVKGCHAYKSYEAKTMEMCTPIRQHYLKPFFKAHDHFRSLVNYMVAEIKSAGESKHALWLQGIFTDPGCQGWPS